MRLTDKSNLEAIYGSIHLRDTRIMLIDHNGKIVYKPEFFFERLNLEQDFEDLLAGKEITVEKEEPKRKELSQD